MAQAKVTPEVKNRRDAQIGDGINRSIIEKGQRINTEILIQKLLNEEEKKVKSEKEKKDK